MTKKRTDNTFTALVLLILAIAIWFSVAALGCAAARPTLGDAAGLLALELVKAPRVRLVTVLDVDTTELFANGQRSGRLGSCRRLPDGGREITIYVARHESVAQLAQTIEHEVRHAVGTCSDQDHEG